MAKEEAPGTPEGQQQEGAETPAQEVRSIETLQAELEEASRERGQFKALAQRVQADLMNLRRRVEEEREQVYHSTAARLIAKLLPIVDDLQRALDHVPASQEASSWLEGIRLIERSLQAVLESEGVTLIEADGKAFDPREHEALYSMESPDDEAGTVVSVIRPGYKLRGRVLRAAQVAVAHGQEPEERKPSDSRETANPEEGKT